MAYNWDTGECNNQGRWTRPASRLRLRNYEGNYYPLALERARDELLYHVDRVKDTAVWKRIRMKTPVNVNGVWDMDDGFGEASNSYSHSGLAENEDFYESCQDPDVEPGDTVPITVTVDIEDKPGNEFIKTKDDNELKASSDDDNDSHYTYSENERDCKIMEKVTVKVEAQELSPKKPDYIIVEEEKKMFDEGLNIKQEPEEETLGKQGTGKKDDGNETEFTQSTRGIKNETVVKQEVEVGISDKNSKIEGRLTAKHTSVMQCLKCDYCDFKSTCKDMCSIKEHLESAVHYSASNYNIDDTGEYILKDEMIVKNNEARFKTKVIKCPVNTCCAIFPEMKACVNHYNIKHWNVGKPKNLFAVVDVLNESECSVQIKPLKCNLCLLTFRTKGSFRRHLEEKHIPKKSSASKLKNTFMCGYCEKCFPWLDVATRHFRKHTPVKNTNFKLTAFLFDKARKFHLSNLGRIEMIDGATNVKSTLGKRTIDLVHLSDEPNIKISRKVDSEIREVTIEIKTDHEEFAMCEDEVVKYDQHATDSDSNDVLSNAIAVTKPEYQDKDLPMQQGSDGAKETLKDAFSCDFCKELTDLEEQMLSHLKEKCHVSASHVLVDEDKNIKFVMWQSNIKGVDSSQQKAYTSCTENCKTLFSSVKSNIEHYIHCHNSQKKMKPCYGVVELKEELVLKLSVDECIICGEKCRKTRHLALHYKMKHSPFPLKDDCDLFFKCPPCQKLMKTFDFSLAHAKKHLDLTKENQFEISVLYLEHGKRKCELVTKYPNNTYQSNEEIQSLRAKIHKIDSTGKSSLKKDDRNKLKRTSRMAKAKLLKILI